MRQMNTIVPEEIPKMVRNLRKANGWTDNGQVVTTAAYALAYLLERYNKVAERSQIRTSRKTCWTSSSASAA